LKRKKDRLKAKTDALQQYASLPIESMLIMQHVDLHHRITIAEAKKPCPNVSPQTIINRIADLVLPELLKMHGKARGTWYSKA
jgi:predicted HTH transcriptional regulator